jgi:selenocysteine lyase/cysteine desulfurase
MSTLTRRTFIRTFSGGALGAAVLYAFPEEARAKYILSFNQDVDEHDEDFWRIVRDQFPLKKDPLFLNNGTMGPSPFVVIDAVRTEMEDVDRTARYGGWEPARAKIARFINADEQEIALTHNVTEGINIVACGLPLKAGDEVILTDHEHAGNALPWLARARRDGIVIKQLKLARTFDETLNRLNSLIGSRTRCIAVPHITCTTGQVLPAKQIARLAREKNLWFFLDGAHTPGMLPLDVKDLGCDFFASCGHKWMMGPKGTGFLWVRKEMVTMLEPHWTGAGADAAWNLAEGKIEFRTDAHRFDFATQSSAIFVGMGAAVDFLYHLGMENVARRDQALAGHLRKRLLQLGERVEILTPDEKGGYGSVVGFRVKGVPYDVLHRQLLEKYHIVTRAVPENGVNCNRISTHIYSSFDEVDRVADAITEIVEGKG